MKLHRIRLEWKPADLWIGAFWKRSDTLLHLWICLLPCLPLHLQFVLRPVPSPAVPRYQQRRNGRETLLSEAEAGRFQACAEQSPLYILFRMALLLGLRRGELLGLQWSDLDLERGLLTIQRTVSWVPIQGKDQNRACIHPPKMLEAVRTIPFSPDLVEVLQVHRIQQRAQQARASRWEPHDLVFCTENGTYLDPSTVLKEFQSILQAAGLPKMSFHALRQYAHA